MQSQTHRLFQVYVCMLLYILNQVYQYLGICVADKWCPRLLNSSFSVAVILNNTVGIMAISTRLDKCGCELISLGSPWVATLYGPCPGCQIHLFLWCVKVITSLHLYMLRRCATMPPLHYRNHDTPAFLAL